MTPRSPSNTMPFSSTRQRMRGRPAGLLLWTLLAIAASGCRSQVDVNDVYGKRGGYGSSSINGTVVLSELFEAAGFEVSNWGRLSPKLTNDQVIVWAPDRFTGPYDDEVDYLENWLAEQPNRTLVYVGRDYTAAIDYWTKVMAKATPEQRLRMRVKLARAHSTHDRLLTEYAYGTDNRWFTKEPLLSYQRIEKLKGIWTEEIPGEAKLWLGSEIEPVDDETLNARTLLASKDGPGVVIELKRNNWGSSKILLVANGSFLLNLPLTDKANQRLASQLIDACGQPSKACFLESEEAPLMITTSDRSPPFFLKLFTTFPVNLIFFHLCVLGIVYCFYVFPIFGRPKTLPDDLVSDFGKHVNALGELLERSGDSRFAQEKIDQYENEVDT